MDETAVEGLRQRLERAERPGPSTSPGPRSWGGWQTTARLSTS